MIVRMHGYLDPIRRIQRSLGLFGPRKWDISLFKILVSTRTNALVEKNRNSRKIGRLGHVQEPRAKVYQRVEHSHGRDSHCDKTANPEHPVCHRKAGAARSFISPQQHVHFELSNIRGRMELNDKRTRKSTGGEGSKTNVSDGQMTLL
jgi:hypothetical protein